MTALDHVFTFSYETYSDAVARGMMRPPDRILQTLMGSDRVGRLLVANPPRSLPLALLRRLRGADAPFPATADHHLVQPLRLRRADPTGLSAVVATFRRYDETLRRAAERHGLDRPAVITTNPLVAAFAPLTWARTVTYFGRDDWLSSEARRAYWPAYRAAYQQISDAEIAVAAVSQQIVDRIAPRGPRVVVPNGVDPAEWSGPAVAAPGWLTDIPEPRAVYVGTIDQRLDVEGVAFLAAARPELQIVLVGPVPDPAYVRGLRHLPNVHLHPSVGRAELVATLRNCQVSLLAHRRTPLTEAMSPLKVYEYLAAGLPVVTIDLPPIRGIADDRVLLAATTAEMGDQVDRALMMGPAAEADRNRFVTENSWAARHRTILDLTCRGALLRRGEDFVPAV